MVDDRIRCRWASDALLVDYHDTEWGWMPQTDSHWLEMIVLETFQAGLSWRTVLQRREGFRAAFKGFDVDLVAEFDTANIDRLMQDTAIIRNRKKIEAAVDNARTARRFVEQFGSVGAVLTEVPHGQLLQWLQHTFRFVGRTTAESIAFATGLLPSPHDPDCWLARG